MNVREQYDRYWRNWRSGPPPADPTGPHHRPPDPEYAALCQEAEQRGYHVELAVGKSTYGEEGKEYRRLTELTVADPRGRRSVAWVPIASKDSMGAVAEIARKRLAATG